MSSLKSSQLQSTYFFDLPLSDVNGVGCAALRLIYHGSERGAFAARTKDAIDLKNIRAFQIGLQHRTVTPMSDIYEYHLVYYRRDLGVNLWSNRFRKGCPTLKKMTRRVKLSGTPSLKPNRLARMYIKSNRPVHIAKYDGGVPTDHNVPQEYLDEFDQRFEGFLMRSKRGFPLVTSLFSAQGLNLKERRDVSVTLSSSPHVLAYTHIEDSK